MPSHSWRERWEPGTLCRRLRVIQRRNKPGPWASMTSSTLSASKLGEGVRRITEGYGSEIVIDAMGGDVLSEALGTLAMGGSLTTLGYSAGRKSTIDVTDLIWKRASMKSFSLFAQRPEMWSAAWKV